VAGGGLATAWGPQGGVHLHAACERQVVILVCTDDVIFQKVLVTLREAWSVVDLAYVVDPVGVLGGRLVDGPSLVE
jgi:hypothetical protein